MKRRKLCLTIAILLITSISLFNVIFMSGCTEIARAIYDTPEEHEWNISRLVEENFIKRRTGCESFTLYPLYDVNDNLKYYMVDLHPQVGIIFVLATPQATQKLFGIWYPAVKQSEWYRYRYAIDEATANYDGGRWQFQPFNEYELSWKEVKEVKFTGILREVSEEGKLFKYQSFVSPYHMAGVLDEKLYLLMSPGYNEDIFVPAVKRDGKFFNLVSMEYIEDINSSEPQEGLSMEFIMLRERSCLG